MKPTSVPARTSAPPGDARASFRGLVRAELRKLLHQRASWAMAVGGIVLIGLMVALYGASPEARSELAGSPDRFLRAMTLILVEGLNLVSGVVLLVAAARLVGMEYSTGAIRVILARGVGRLHLLAAKLAALAVLALALLAALAAVAAVQALVLARLWHVDVSAAGAWAALGPAAMAVAVSMAACLLLGVAAATVGRSTALGAGAVMAFFPADNLIALLGQGFQSDLLLGLRQYLLGPNLNALPSTLLATHGQILGSPLPVDRTHLLVVIALWCAGFLVLSAGLVRSRDVHE